MRGYEVDEMVEEHFGQVRKEKAMTLQEKVARKLALMNGYQWEKVLLVSKQMYLVDAAEIIAMVKADKEGEK